MIIETIMLAVPAIQAGITVVAAAAAVYLVAGYAVDGLRG